MEKYKTLFQVMGIDQVKYNTLSEFFQQNYALQSDVANICANLLDKGFLNPNQNAFYYGLGPAAAKAFAKLERLDLLQIPNSDLIRFDIGVLKSDWYYNKVALPTTAEDPFEKTIWCRPYSSYPTEDQYSKSKILTMSDGDGDLTGMYNLASVNANDFYSVGLISSEVLQKFKDSYGYTSGVSNQIFLLSQIDLGNFLLAIMQTFNKRGEARDLVMELCSSQNWRRIAGFHVPSWNNPPDGQCNPADSDHVYFGTEYTDYANIFVHYTVGVSQPLFYPMVVATSVEKAACNDLWLSAWVIKANLFHYRIESVSNLCAFIDELAKDFAAAAFDNSASQSDMKNWIYNYIQMNMGNSTCKNKLLSGNTLLPILDPFHNL